MKKSQLSEAQMQSDALKEALGKSGQVLSTQRDSLMGCATSKTEHCECVSSNLGLVKRVIATNLN